MSMPIKQLSADQARRFDHFSVHNEVAAEAACPTLECRAYSDIFTFRRWLVQGFKVKGGERGTVITTWVVARDLDEREEHIVRRSRPRKAVVFCRHQVEPRMGARQATDHRTA